MVWFVVEPKSTPPVVTVVMPPLVSVRLAPFMRMLLTVVGAVAVSDAVTSALPVKVPAVVAAV